MYYIAPHVCVGIMHGAWYGKNNQAKLVSFSVSTPLHWPVLRKVDALTTSFAVQFTVSHGETEGDCLAFTAIWFLLKFDSTGYWHYSIRIRFDLTNHYSHVYTRDCLSFKKCVDCKLKIVLSGIGCTYININVFAWGLSSWIHVDENGHTGQIGLRIFIHVLRSACPTYARV